MILYRLNPKVTEDYMNAMIKKEAMNPLDILVG